jgi:predicted ester cyclase
MTQVTEVPPLAQVLRRYSFGYTAAHDFDVADQVIVDDYVFRMGPFVAQGREAQYKPATRKQYRQFPGLGFTVHDLIISPDRASLCFTEHGRSLVYGREAAWRGVSLYRWNGERLTECRVEQDYYTRRLQLEGVLPATIPPPANDPWLTPVLDPDPDTERVVREWLLAGGVLNAKPGWVDDEAVGASERARLDDAETEILDLFSAGSRAAFHVVVHGVYAGGLRGSEQAAGRPADLYCAGQVTVVDGAVVAGQLVTDRLALQRRLAAEAG